MPYQIIKFAYKFFITSEQLNPEIGALNYDSPIFDWQSPSANLFLLAMYTIIKAIFDAADTNRESDAQYLEMHTHLVLFPPVNMQLMRTPILTQ